MKTGVYFFLRRKKVVYIGATKIFPIRFNVVKKEMDFDRIRLIECSEDKMLSYETRLIALFTPQYNLRKNGYHPMKGRTNKGSGRKKGSGYLGKMEVGQTIEFNKKYHPSGDISSLLKHFPDRIYTYYRNVNQYYITRVN